MRETRVVQENSERLARRMRDLARDHCGFGRAREPNDPSLDDLFLEILIPLVRDSDRFRQARTAPTAGRELCWICQ